MKYTAALFALVFLLTACNHRSDATIRRNLPGAWHYDLSSTADGGGTSTFTIATNGDFVCQTVVANGIHTVELAGTVQVADGYLIETVTRSTLPKARVPFVSRAQIIRADAREMIVSFDGTDKVVLKKATP